MLTHNQAKEIQGKILSGEMQTEEILEIFRSLEGEKLSKEALSGFLEASLEVANKFEPGFEVLDVCGTGGDGLHTFNISTLTALVCAGAGVPVAKHGNRSASSKCGGADVLEALGVNIDLSPNQAKKCLEKTGVVFLFAPNFHPAFRFVKEARTKYAKKTYFNILGPLLNPAGAKYQLIGITDESLVDLIGETLMFRGSQKIWLVKSKEGMDEVSISSSTEVWEFIKTGNSFTKRHFTINPEDFGMKIVPIEEIVGGDVELNKQIALRVLENKASEAQRNIVILNAGAGLSVFGKTDTLEEGVKLAREILESGKAKAKLEEFVLESNKLKND
jgi:anthranilate phosphoribosyltransferase